MPCASVSENSTRVSDENLNGGLRSVTRPSSSSITRHAKRRAVHGPRVRGSETAEADVLGDPADGQSEQDEEDDRERDDDKLGADVRRVHSLDLVGPVVGVGARVGLEV